MIPSFINEEIKTLKGRTVLAKVVEYLDLPDIIVLLGMRQTGKTRLLYLAIQALREKGVQEFNLFFFSLEDPTILSAFNKNIKELQMFLERERTLQNSKVYILIDEIQYLKNPSNFLKYYYDTQPSYKFIVTGSSTFQLKQKFKDSLAGRKKTILVKPLSFEEFLGFKDIGIATSRVYDIQKIQLDAITEEKIKILHNEYLAFGGHPKVAQLPSQDLKIEELKGIYNDYVRKDIKDIAKIENTDAYNALIQLLASQTSGLLNTVELSSTAGLNHLTVKKYLFLLENSFVISLLKPYFQNKRKEISKMPKVYMEDTGMRNAVLGDFRQIGARQDAGSLAENFVFNELEKNKRLTDGVYFWRTLGKQEVDFVYQTQEEVIPIEVKYQVFREPKIPSGMRSFLKAHHCRTGVVVTRDFFGEARFEKTIVHFLPAYLI